MKKTLVSRIAAVLLIAVVALSSSLIAKDKTNSDTKEIKILTSAYSFMCKNNIETAVKKLDGVIEAYLNLDDKTLTVKYLSEKVTSEKIKNTVFDLGYKAEIKENPDGDSSELGYKSTLNPGVNLYEVSITQSDLIGL